METRQTGCDFFFCCLIFGDDRFGVADAREVDAFDDNVQAGCAKRIARTGIRQFGDCADITCADFGNFGVLLAADHVDTADLFRRTRCGVGDGHIRRNLPGQHFEEREAAILVSNRLKDKGAGRTIRIERERFLFAVNNLNFLFAFRGRREVINDAVQKCFCAETGYGRAAENRADRAGSNTGADAGRKFFIRKRFAAKEFFHQFVVGFGDVFGQFLTVFFDFIGH